MIGRALTSAEERAKILSGEFCLSGPSDAQLMMKRLAEHVEALEAENAVIRKDWRWADPNRYFIGDQEAARAWCAMAEPSGRVVAFIAGCEFARNGKEWHDMEARITELEAKA